MENILKELEERREELENYFNEEKNGGMELTQEMAVEIEGELSGINFAINLLEKEINKGA